MNKLYCMNCHNDKTADRLGDMYCLQCETAMNEAAENATREGLDAGAARRTALMNRAPTSMSGKQHPGLPFQRISTEEFDKRQAIVPGSPEDPRRGRQ